MKDIINKWKSYTESEEYKMENENFTTICSALDDMDDYIMSSESLSRRQLTKPFSC